MEFRELLRQKGFTQTRLSQVAGVSQSNLSIYCNYREALESSSMVTRLKIAKALDMTIDVFESVLHLEPATIVASNRQSGKYEVTEVK
jgi:transcriptional regulator with XRE-family HTH domain